jgi:signal transduction histidine kinase
VIRGLVRLALALLFGLAALPAAAADAPFPKAVEAAFADAKAAMMKDPDEVLRHVAAAEQQARAIKEPRQRALALATGRWLAGEAHLRANRSDAAAPLLAEGLRLIEPFKEALKLRGDLTMSQGQLYVQRDQAALALVSYQNAIRIFRAAKEPRSVAIAWQNMALLYSSANDTDNAAKYFAEAANAFDRDPMLSLSLHNNRGNVLLTAERYDEAEAEYLKALPIARDKANPFLEALVLGNVARARVEARKYDLAAQAASQGLALTRSPEARGARPQLLATAARIAMERNDLKNARKLILQAFKGIDLARTTSSFRYAHTVAYMIFERTGDAAMALEHLEAVRRLTDEAAKVATTTGAALAAANFDFATQETKIANLRAEQIRKSAEFQRTLFLGIGGATLVIILLLSVALFLIRRSRNQVRAANVVLGETNVALEKALKAKTEFLATTSHEIRTPLNGILGMTQVMLSDPRLAADMRDRIGIVHGAGVTMRALVDDILDVAKMETGNLTVDAAPMDLCALLRDVTRMWEEQARAKGLAFGLELSHAPHWIVSDAGRLRQIVFNLLSNAIKFTERGGVTVRALGEGEDDARRLRLVISDTGIGIPPDKRDEIFESFKQVDAGTTRKFGGTGLGLTICRNLAQALGGDIAVDSVEGEGSRFIVDLPLVPAEVPADAADKVTGTGTMLVLDRNPIARSMLRTLLEPRVGTLRFLATPDEALAALGEGADVTHLLVDEATLKAAGDDPFGVLAGLAAAANAAGAASAILWMKPDDETRAGILTLGISQVIEKPISGAALIEALVSDAKENSGKPGPGPLVSRAA